MPVAGAVIGGVATIAGGAMAKSGANAAANAQNQATAQTVGLQREIYNTNRQILAPNMDRGNWAGNALSGMLGLHSDPAQNQKAQDQFRQFIANSDYGFQFGEGANRINSGYAGAGTIKSGAAMQGMERFRQNLQDGYRTQYMNALSGQEGMGLSGANALAGVGTNFANASGNALMANGQAQADAAIARAGIGGSMVNSLANIAGSVISPTRTASPQPYGTNDILVTRGGGFW